MNGNELLHEVLRREIRHKISLERPNFLDSERELGRVWNVSRTTVRRALKELEKEHLLLPIRGKGYRVNYAVADGRTGAGSIGILMRTDSGEYEHHIFSRMLDCVYRSGMTPVVALYNGHYESPEEKLYKLLAECAGVILCSTADFRVLSSSGLGRQRHRMIFIPLPPAGRAEAYAAPDFEDGFFQITNLLLNHGHRRILLLTSAPERRRGFRNAFRSRSIRIDTSLIRDCQGFRHLGYEAMERALEKSLNFTAVLCQNDPCALGVMECCFRHGISVPGDLSICGADNVAGSELYPVPLTTIGVETDVLCRSALDLLLEGIRTGAVPSGLSLKMKLEIRASVAQTNQNTCH